MTVADQRLLLALDSRNAEQAAHELYRGYGPELYGFAVSRLGDRQLAEEVVQDVFTNVWRRATDYDVARGTLRAWLYGITRNAIVDAERRRGRRPRTLAHEPRDEASADDPIELALMRWQLQLAFERLTHDHREAIRLTHVEGLKLTEVAAVLGLPVGTVKSRVYYAMQALRLACEELEILP